MDPASYMRVARKAATKAAVRAAVSKNIAEIPSEGVGSRPRWVVACGNVIANGVGAGGRGTMLMAQYLRRAGIDPGETPIERFLAPGIRRASLERLIADILTLGDFFFPGGFELEEFFREQYFSDRQVALVDNLFLTDDGRRRPLSALEVQVMERMLALTPNQIILMTRRESQVVFNMIKAVTPINRLFSQEHRGLILALVQKYVIDKPFILPSDEPIVRKVFPFPLDFIPLQFGEIPPGLEAFRRSLGKIVVEKPQISIPRLNDIIKLVPDRFLDPAEVRARTGRIAQALRTSPTPGIVQAIAGILTAIDDTEDLLSTIFVTGSIIVRMVPGLGRFIVPLLHPLFVAVGILELFSVFRFVTAGSKPLKKAAVDLVRANPFSTAARRRAFFRALKRRPGVGALIEALQVSNSLFGVGLSLGPIVGFATDIITTGSQAIAHFIAPPDVAERMRAEFGRAGFGTAGRIRAGPRAVAQAVRIISGSPMLATMSQELPLEQHIRHLAAVRLALDVVEPFFHTDASLAITDLMLDVSCEPNSAMHATTRDICHEQGISVEGTCCFPVPGAPRRMTVPQMLEVYPPLISSALRRQVEEHEPSVELWTLLDLAEQVGRKIIDVLDQQEGQWERRINPDTMNSLEATWREIIPPQGTPRIALQAAIDDWVKAGEGAGGVVAPYEAMKQIAERHWGSIAV